MSTFNLPDLGEGLPTADIRQWHVKVGDHINVDDPLVSVETAKAIVEVPSPQAGTVTARFAEPGDTVATGAPLVEFDNEPAKRDSATVVGVVQTSDVVIEEDARGFTPTTHLATTQPQASPAIRVLARTRGIDLTHIQGTGPNGAITKRDLDNVQSNTPNEAESESHIENLTAVERTMAKMMEKSHREVVPVTVIDDADISHWPNGTDITVTLIEALVHACKTQPHLNAHFDGEALTRRVFDCVHLGLALDTEHGLFVPVIKDVAQRSRAELRQTIDTLKQRAHQRALTLAEMQGATVVLSNFGSIGGKYASPIVVPPTVAIVGVGHCFTSLHAKQQTADDTLLPLSLTFDHRAVTGAQASAFLAAIIAFCQHH